MFFKWLLRIILAPVMLVLKIIILFLIFTISISSSLLGLAAGLLVPFGILGFFVADKTSGIIVLVVAFLISPYGIPLAADWLLNRVDDLWCWFQDIVYY